MAGDWIPLDVEIHNKPKVLEIVRLLDADDQMMSRKRPGSVPRVSADEVVGRLTRFWCWAQKHTSDGILRNTKCEDISRAVGYEPSFWEIVFQVGWLTEVDGIIEIPAWDVWLSNGAKARLKACEKKREQRKKPVPILSRKCPSKKGTTGEERRGEDKEETPLPPLPFSSEKFSESWEAWVEHRREIGKPLKPRGRVMALEKLKAMGEAKAIEAMVNSMAGGWQGLFDPKPNGRKDEPGGLSDKRREFYRQEQQQRRAEAARAEAEAAEIGKASLEVFQEKIREARAQGAL